jgi:hypothetical protein
MTYQEEVRQRIADLMEIGAEMDMQHERLMTVIVRMDDEELSREVEKLVNGAAHVIEIATQLLQIAIAHIPDEAKR